MHDMFPQTFFFLQQEGFLIRSSLTVGLTELRKANVHNKGAFYSSLFNLSVGTERLLKCIVIIEHMLQNQLAVPTKKELKAYGHDIENLYDKCQQIAITKGQQFPARNQLHPLEQKLLSLLSDFAKITRYHNLDALSLSQPINDDPLEDWNNILLSTLDEDVPKKRKEKILMGAKLIANAIDDMTITIMHGMDKKPLTTEEAMAMPGLHDEAVRFVILRIIKMLCSMKELIAEQSYQAYGLGLRVPPYPQMQEFLDWLWDDRQYVLRKKKWP